tara:strand:- start:158 stop:415 length:258 start_codon:yes stop_codon:yes gene_type:complete
MEEIKEEIQKLKIEIKETLEGLNQSKSEVIAIDAKDYKERYGRSQPWKTRLEDAYPMKVGRAISQVKRMERSIRQIERSLQRRTT